MTVLAERELHPLQSSRRAMRDAGGLWVASGAADPAAIVAEVKQRGIRALEVHQRDLSYLAELPDLEFLAVRSDPVDVTAIGAMSRLRFLSFSGTWGGRLDFGAFPRLEWFNVVECPRDGGGLETLLRGHDRLYELALGRYPWSDLVPLGNLDIRRLLIWDTRSLTSLRGGEALAATLRALDLAVCPRLASLDGIDALVDLEVLILDRVRSVTTLDWVARLPRLKYLDVQELKDVQSLGPLAGHPALEFVAFGRVRDLNLDPLAEIPNLKVFNTGTYRWNRDLHQFPYLHDVGPSSPLALRYQAMRVG